MKKNIWQDNVADGLITQIPRTSRFKNEIPGRLFVSSVNWRTLKITQDVDYHLQSIVREISSYIRDINDFLCKLGPICPLTMLPIPHLRLFRAKPTTGPFFQSGASNGNPLAWSAWRQFQPVLCFLHPITYYRQTFSHKLGWGL